MPLTYDDSVDNVQNQPGTTLAVTASSTSSVYVTGSVVTSQSNWPAGATVTIGGQPVYINTTATLSVSQSNTPAGTQTVSGNFNVGVNGTVTTSQSNIPAGTQPVSIAATVTTSQSNVPAGTVVVTAALASPVTTTVTGTIDAVFTGSIPVYVTSSIPVYITASTSPTVTTQNPSLTGVALKAANVNRKGLIIYNQTSQALYVKMGTTATLTDFTLILDVSGYYESPFAYNGAYWGIQPAAATGLVYVTEVT